MSPELLPEETKRGELFVDATVDEPTAAAIWKQIGWAVIVEPEHRDMGLTPEEFDRQLSAGCPECGAAWQELLAIGFTAPRVYSGEATWDGYDFVVSAKPLYHLDQRAVRVECCSGHAVEFDWYSGLSQRRAPVSPWLAAAGAAVAGLAMLYVVATQGSR